MSGGEIGIERFKEDTLKVRYLNQVSKLEHIKYRPKSTDTFWQKLFKTRDIFLDDNSPINNFVFCTWKGMVFGVSTVFALYSALVGQEVLVEKKITNFNKLTSYGTIKSVCRTAKPYLLLGALGGAGWYVWFNLIWTRNSQWRPQTDYTVGTGLYSMALCSLAFHPRYCYLGLVAGLVIGSVGYEIVRGIFNPKKDTPGFFIRFDQPPINPQLQDNLDSIYYLSSLIEIRSGKYLDLI